MARRVPAMQVTQFDPAQHGRRALEELHGRRRRADRQLFGQADEVSVGLTRDGGQRFRGLGEEWERLAAKLACHVATKLE